mmetsp:Transcript_7555/g.5448  ORF Transcript_7555/g.5448 Transcript_7555/m.5448 type:complete len:97 (-) Transcript_7555:7120-7410(-)
MLLKALIILIRVLKMSVFVFPVPMEPNVRLMAYQFLSTIVAQLVTIVTMVSRLRVKLDLDAQLVMITKKDALSDGIKIKHNKMYAWSALLVIIVNL